MSNTCSPAPSPVGPREEEFLEIFFTHISNFAFDKAKELAEKERDSHKASFGSSWGLVVHSLCFFALAEKTYMSLTFLGQKWFGRAKDNPRNSYSSLMLEFKKVEENVRMIDATSSDPTGEIILAHICGQLCQFLSARLKCMDFYEQMSMMGTSRNLSYEDLATIISDLIQSNQKSFHHPVLSSIKSSFSLECEIMHHLLVAQIRMTEWQFLPSLLQLHEANSKLSSWGATALAKDMQSKKSAFGSISLKHSSLPALYQWLIKLKGSMLAKFTLYFYETLSKQSTPVEMKGLTAKTTEDYVAKIISFQKKSDASHICLVLDIQGIEGTFKGPGYHHPNKQSDPPKGLDSYPAMFTYPGDRPAQHWPTVVMMINDKAADTDKPVCTYDKTKQSTYFITRVDHRVTLVVIFECKKSERDSYVNSFMTDMHSLLKGVKLFASLKPGMKG